MIYRALRWIAGLTRCFRGDHAYTLIERLPIVISQQCVRCGATGRHYFLAATEPPNPNDRRSYSPAPSPDP